MCFCPGYFISAQNYLKVRDIFCFQYCQGVYSAVPLHYSAVDSLEGW